MRLTKHRRATLAAVNMTPMIDIVFLLIIFFMTVTQVSEVNKQQLELPQLKGSEDQKPSTIIINVDQEGLIQIAARQRTIPEVVNMIGNELQSVGGNTNLLTVVLRADRRGTSRTVNQVVENLARIGVNQVRIAVQTEG